MDTPALTPVPPSDLMIYTQDETAYNPAVVYLSTLKSTRSQRTMRDALNAIAEVLGVPRQVAPRSTKWGVRDEPVTYLHVAWGLLRYQHTARILALLLQASDDQGQPKFTAATINLRLSALRGVLKEAWKLGQMTAEEYQRAVAVGSVTSSSLLRGHALSFDDLDRLVEVCSTDPTPAGVRDAALVQVMYCTTARRSEVAGVQLAHYDRRNQSIKIMKAKGRKERLTFLDDRAATALQRWLAIRSETPGPLFCHIRIGKTNPPHYHTHPERGLSDQAIYKIITTRSRAAGIAPARPHDLRRTAITDLLMATNDPILVAGISGHEDVNTVRKYDYRSSAVRRTAVRRMRQGARERARLEEDDGTER